MNISGGEKKNAYEKCNRFEARVRRFSANHYPKTAEDKGYEKYVFRRCLNMN